MDNTNYDRNIQMPGVVTIDGDLTASNIDETDRTVSLPPNPPWVDIKPAIQVTETPIDSAEALPYDRTRLDSLFAVTEELRSRGSSEATIVPSKKQILSTLVDPSLDPRVAHPNLNLSGRVISVAFNIPYVVDFLPGTEWVK